MVKHDRDCIRRRDRAPNLTVPMKPQRQAPADKAKVQSLAAAVTSKALELAAASAASAAP